MFTRIVELTTKPGKNRQLSDTINDKVLPILKKQKGFVDETVLVSDKEDNRVLSLSFWNSREDAEEYHRAEYQKVHDLVRHLLEAEPMIRTFDVHTSTTHELPPARPPKARSGNFANLSGKTSTYHHKRRVGSAPFPSATQSAPNIKSYSRLRE